MSDLPSSRLGTKAHWDEVYAREIGTFKDIGDEGEVWFGEESAESMCEWCIDRFGVSTDDGATSPTILDVGTGNGHLPLLFLEAGYPAHLITGIDYSQASVDLCKAISEQHGVTNVRWLRADVINDQETKKLVQDCTNGAGWHLVTDKGTFDAIALFPHSDKTPHPASLYPQRIASLLAGNVGIFLITSCNFTLPELKSKFANSDTGLKFLDSIDRPTFSFGGSTGSTITTAAFIKG